METCYRHPNRETAVACSSCDRPICPDCMTATSVGMRCPECAGQTTRVRTARSIAAEPALTYLLIAINVLIALGAFFDGGETAGVGGSRLITDGGLNGGAVADGEWYRIVTAGFLHAGPLHLLFNMFALWILGGLIEPAVGRLRFALLYFVSLLAGSFGALLVEPDALTVGASGAVFGLMGAAVVLMRNRGINLMESGLGIWLGINLLITFTIPGISIGGHIGGLIGGTVAAAVLFELPDRVAMPRAAPAALAAALGALAVAGSIAVA